MMVFITSSSIAPEWFAPVSSQTIVSAELYTDLIDHAIQLRRVTAVTPDAQVLLSNSAEATNRARQGRALLCTIRDRTSALDDSYPKIDRNLEQQIRETCHLRPIQRTMDENGDKIKVSLRSLVSLIFANTDLTFPVPDARDLLEGTSAELRDSQKRLDEAYNEWCVSVCMSPLCFTAGAACTCISCTAAPGYISTDLATIGMCGGGVVMCTSACFCFAIWATTTAARLSHRRLQRAMLDLESRMRPVPQYPFVRV